MQQVQGVFHITCNPNIKEDNISSCSHPPQWDPYNHTSSCSDLMLVFSLCSTCSNLAERWRPILVSFLCSSWGVDYWESQKPSPLNKGHRSLQKLNYRLKWIWPKEQTCTPSVRICSETCCWFVPSSQSGKGAGRCIKVWQALRPQRRRRTLVEPSCTVLTHLCATFKKMWDEHGCDVHLEMISPGSAAGNRIFLPAPLNKSLNML